MLLIHPTIRPVGVNYLKENVKLFFAPNGDEKTIIDMIKRYQIDAVITRTEKITRHILESCPTLKIIGQHGVGLDNIDIKAAERLGISVINVPDATYVSVAEHTMMLILALSKNLFKNDFHVRNSNWEYREQVFPMEICRKSLFIIGYGRIGSKVGELASAFNMNVIVFDPFIRQESIKEQVRVVNSLEEGLNLADFVSLHIPLTKQTKHLIAETELNMMKETAYLINASRGRLVNQKDLLDALNADVIKGAGLDVLEVEPPLKDDPILRSDKVIFTPHLAGDTLEAKNRCSLSLVEDVVIALQGKTPKNLVQLS